MAVESPTDGALRRGEALLALRRHREAIPWLQRAIAANPGDVTPYCRLALALDRAGEPAHALETIRQAVLVDPNAEWPYRLRAWLLIQIGDAPGALEAAETAVRLAPEVPEAFSLLVRARSQNRLWAEAEAAADRLRTLAPDRAYAFTTSADLALARNDNLGAEGYYRQALALDPSDDAALHNLGLALRRQGRLREAAEAFYAAARLDPACQLSRDALNGIVGPFVGLWGRSGYLLRVALPAVGCLTMMWLGFVVELVTRSANPLLNVGLLLGCYTLLVLWVPRLYAGTRRHLARKAVAVECLSPAILDYVARTRPRRGWQRRLRAIRDVAVIGIVAVAVTSVVCRLIDLFGPLPVVLAAATGLGLAAVAVLAPRRRRSSAR